MSIYDTMPENRKPYGASGGEAASVAALTTIIDEASEKSRIIHRHRWRPSAPAIPPHRLKSMLRYLAPARPPSNAVGIKFSISRDITDSGHRREMILRRRRRALK